jgi:tetratricopeptide (TPR) repeat protein
VICYKDQPAECWAQREADFLRFAEEIYSQNQRSETVIHNVADYLAQGLQNCDRAIEILWAAHRDKLLGESGQYKLVGYLHARNRYGESIGLLQGLVEAGPHNLEYRRLLMYAYFRTNRKDELMGFFKQTDDFFHQKNRWGEGPMAVLAGACLQSELFEAAVEYYKELIPLHERTARNRGIGDGTLSAYYGGQARAFAGLKKTPEAVEAACGAIVSWGSNSENRAHALEALRKVLQDCEKLDAYTADLDAQVAKDGRDNPLVRKALGQVYSERGQFDKAIVQLRAALELQPNDAEIHQALVACYDKQNDKQGAIRQLLSSVQLSRRDINLFKELGWRLADLHEDRESERAYTSIVEVLASESESHAMLAEIRESQNRWGDAIDEWRQVARLRSLEPTGLLRLAAAQVHEKQWDVAAETVRQLRAKSWPQRFDKTESQIQELEQQLRKGS